MGGAGSGARSLARYGPDERRLAEQAAAVHSPVPARWRYGHPGSNHRGAFERESRPTRGDGKSRRGGRERRSRNRGQIRSDGYTIVLVAPSLAISTSLYSKLNYDAVKDFAPVSLVATVPNVMVTHPSVPAATLAEFIRLVKTKPGEMNFGSGGSGTSNHLAGELFNIVAGVKLVHVPYKGVNLAMNDVLSGQIHLVVIGVPAAAPHIKAGKLRALALVAPQRAAALPEVPTVAEAGLPNFESPRGTGSSHPRHAEGHRHAAQCRARENHARARAEGTPRGDGHRSGDEHAGRIRGLHQEGNREVGRGRSPGRVES